MSRGDDFRHRAMIRRPTVLVISSGEGVGRRPCAQLHRTAEPTVARASLLNRLRAPTWAQGGIGSARREGARPHRRGGRCVSLLMALLATAALATCIRLGVAHVESMQQLSLRRWLSDMAYQAHLASEGGQRQTSFAGQLESVNKGGSTGRTLSFEVCNGFGNQRLAVLSGAAILWPAIAVHDSWVLCMKQSPASFLRCESTEHDRILPLQA